MVRQLLRVARVGAWRIRTVIGGSRWVVRPGRSRRLCWRAGRWTAAGA